jgi:hypothetical protein
VVAGLTVTALIGLTSSSGLASPVAGAGVAVAPSVTALPHASQNLSPGSSTAPQCGHFAAVCVWAGGSVGSWVT